MKTRIHESPEDNYNTLIRVITEIKNKHMPKKQVKFKYYKHKIQPWITSGIIQCIKHKNQLYKKWKNTSPQNFMYNQHKDNFKNYFDNLRKIMLSGERD